MSAPLSKPTPEQLAHYAQKFSESLALKFFGVRISFPDGDRVQVDLDEVRPEHRGGLGSQAVNGGILAGIFDLALGCTAALLNPTTRSATVQLSMSFERPLQGNSVRAVARVDRSGGSTVFSSAVILDEKGQECARALGVIRTSHLPWASGGSPAV